MKSNLLSSLLYTSHFQHDEIRIWLSFLNLVFTFRVNPCKSLSLELSISFYKARCVCSLVRYSSLLPLAVVPGNIPVSLEGLIRVFVIQMTKSIFD